MSTLRIHFHGLIVHVGPDTPTNIKTHCVVLDVPGHAPLLVVNGSDLDPAQSSPRIVYLSKGDELSFSNVITGDARLSSSSNWSLLPSLRDLSKPTGTQNPDLHPHVKPPKPNVGALHQHALLHIDYPQGDMKITDFFGNQATYMKDTAVTQCVPSELTLEVPTASTGGVVLTVTHRNGEDPDIIPIRENGALTIANVSAGGRHFHMYERLLVHGRLVGVKEEKDIPCPDAAAKLRGQEKGYGLPHPECSNSAWP